MDASVILLVVTALRICVCDETSTVNIGDKWKIKGTTISSSSPELPGARKIHQFMGIKYATYKERFARPELYQPTTESVEATKPGPICFQNPLMLRLIWRLKVIPEMSEDCLYLNIWTPTLSSTAKLPVLFYIHGGGFTNGFGDYHKGDILTSIHDVVYVSINYRLAGLGFLSTGDSRVPGNMGLLDQLEALKWVNKYVSYFGGDPEKVTISGLSAGSMSVSYHIVSPLSRGLFKRGIMQSGSSIGRFAQTKKECRNLLIQAAKLMPGVDENSVLETFKTMDAQTLVNITLPFQPSVDDYFMHDLPVNLYNKGEFSHVDIITGTTKNDGYMLMDYFGKFFLNITMDANSTKGDIMKSLHVFLHMFYNETNEEFIKLVYKTYIGDNKRGIDMVRGLEQVFRDGIFTGGTFDGAQRHSSTEHNVFVYEYTHHTDFFHFFKRPAWVVADHGFDMMMHTGDCYREEFKILFNSTCSGDDKEFSKLIMKYWVNFATTGDPNNDDVTYWPKYTCETQKYLELNNYPTVSAVYNPERVRLWADTLFKMDRNRKGVYLPRNNPCDKCLNSSATTLLPGLIFYIILFFVST